MDERARFVLAVEAGEEPVAAVCRRFGISRDKGYKWLRRWQAEGAAGLADRSRAPRSHPQAVAEELLEACLALRRQHPTWGPAKVKAALGRRSPGQPWPAASTIGALFDREGLTVRRKLRRRTPPGGPLFAAEAANDVWSIDFKGWFRTGDGIRVDPLTLSDACSRYLLRCQVVGRPDTTHVWPILDAAFREYGLPLRLRSDNGSPFATTGAGGLSRLSVRAVKAGVLPERITPGKPQENGRLERLHLTLLQDTASPPAATLRAQAARFRDFRATYNQDRPHAALGNATPAECYAPSPRRWDGVLRSPEPAVDAVRRVKSNGLIRWHGVLVYISEALAGEPIGLDEGDDGLWTVRYGPILLGLLADRGDTLIRLPQKGCGLVDNAARCPQGPQPPQPQPPRT
ncbi:MAG TPA: IS481 family transposase [Solirubrobacterales bacterium]|jgi:transposase InsO family protein|nr:IS481 family transposase [Solirubrobacterales bacterium]